MPTTESYPLPQYDDLAKFHFIVLNLSAGGPATPGRPPNWIYVKNKFPSDWERWGRPRVSHRAPADHRGEAIDWGQISAHMTVEYALWLMKAAGYRDTFALVYLFRGGRGELEWAFDYYGGSDTAVVYVSVTTGRVRFNRGTPR